MSNVFLSEYHTDDILFKTCFGRIALIWAIDIVQKSNVVSIKISILSAFLYWVLYKYCFYEVLLIPENYKNIKYLIVYKNMYGHSIR